MATNTFGGGRDLTAVIGHAPEMRDWRPGDRAVTPHIDPTARIEAFVTIDAGAEAATFIGPRVWLMKHVHVGHDAVIGEGTELAPHCCVGGFVVIGCNVKVGQGALFKPEITVGDGAVIGMRRRRDPRRAGGGDVGGQSGSAHPADGDAARGSTARSALLSGRAWALRDMTSHEDLGAVLMV
jgi:hypothetical protein